MHCLHSSLLPLKSNPVNTLLKIKFALNLDALNLLGFFYGLHNILKIYLDKPCNPHFLKTVSLMIP